MTTFLIVRHGESQANAEGRAAGWFNAPLTERGIRQAELARAYILSRYSIDFAVSSDLDRARVTGETVIRGTSVPLCTDKRLRETYLGKWEGREFSELLANAGEAYKTFCTNIGVAQAEGGESFWEMHERVAACLCELAENNPDKTVLITTHAGPIRGIETYFRHVKPEDVKNIPWVPNVSLTVLQTDGKTASFSLVGYAEYLGEYRTELPKSI